MSVWWLGLIIPVVFSLAFVLGVAYGNMGAHRTAYEKLSRIKFDDWLKKYLQVNDYALVPKEIAHGLQHQRQERQPDNHCCSKHPTEADRRTECNDPGVRDPTAG